MMLSLGTVRWSVKLGDLVLVVKDQDRFLPEPLLGMIVSVRDTIRYIYPYEVLIDNHTTYLSHDEIRPVEDHK